MGMPEKQQKPTFKLKPTNITYSICNRDYEEMTLSVIIWGNVYENPRFPNGEHIHTSAVVNIRGRSVETRNSIYLLIDDAEEEQLQSKGV